MHPVKDEGTETVHLTLHSDSLLAQVPAQLCPWAAGRAASVTTIPIGPSPAKEALARAPSCLRVRDGHHPQRASQCCLENEAYSCGESCRTHPPTHPMSSVKHELHLELKFLTCWALLPGLVRMVHESMDHDSHTVSTRIPEGHTAVRPTSQSPLPVLLPH